MIDPETLKRQTEDFEKHLPNWTNEQADATARATGDVVSAVAWRAFPNGVTLMFATKTQNFGPFHLTAVAAHQLLQQLAQEAAQTVRIGR